MAKKGEVQVAEKVNKRFSIKVLPQAAKVDLVDYNDGVVDVATEHEAKMKFMELLEKNSKETLRERGIRISLYHYRMPLVSYGSDDAISSKEYRSGKLQEEMDEVELKDTAKKEIFDELAEIARQIGETNDENVRRELIETAKTLNTALAQL